MSKSLAAAYSKWDSLDVGDDTPAKPRVNVTKLDKPTSVTIPGRPKPTDTAATTTTPATSASPAQATATATTTTTATTAAPTTATPAAANCANCQKPAPSPAAASTAAAAAPFKRCGACHRVSYCSPECQRADWKSHKPNCTPKSKAAGGTTATATTTPAAAAGSGSNSGAKPRVATAAELAAGAAATGGVGPLTPEQQAKLAASDPQAAAAIAQASGSGKYVKRKPVMYDGRVVYEWEQELEDVHIYITPPPGLSAKDIACTITPNHVSLGVKGNPPYLDEDTGGAVVVKQSFWMLEDGLIHIQLTKVDLASVWPFALRGRFTTSELNAMESQQVQQKIMLERFQQEHPGFDFSQAQFSGTAPDPRKFLGGMDYSKVGK